MQNGSLVTFKNPDQSELGQIWQIIEIRQDRALCQLKNADMILEQTNVFLLSDLKILNN